jgi:uncharacterized damage-inducible protein DinB
MNETARIQDQLQRAFDGSAWSGPSFWQLLKDVFVDKAAAKPLPQMHSIWEIVGHVVAWQKIVVRRLAGEKIIEVAECENWPPVLQASAAAWKRALEELEESHRHLWEAVGRLQDARLEDPVPGQDYSVYVMLHGVVQHNLYHAGQIALLKKA